MNYTYNTIGTCSARIDFEVRETYLPDGTTRRTLHNVIFYGGCNGNLQGISRLVEGMEIDAVLEKLEGISSVATEAPQVVPINCVRLCEKYNK